MLVKKFKMHLKNYLAPLFLMIIIATGLLLLTGCQQELEKINANWPATSFEIDDTVKVAITTEPADYDLSSLTISDNDIAEMSYSDGVATITFKSEGSARISFSSGDIKSSSVAITVTDPEAEAQRQKEAEEKAAQEAAEELARQEAEKQAQKAAAQQAAQQAASQQSHSQQSQSQQSVQTQQPTQSQMVWIPQTGSKYHNNPSCSNMKNPQQVTLSQAQNMGYEPCKKCY